MVFQGDLKRARSRLKCWLTSFKYFALLFISSLLINIGIFNFGKLHFLSWLIIMFLFQIYFKRSLNLSFFFCFYLLNGYIFRSLQNFLFLFFRLNICFNSCKLFLIFFCLFRNRFTFSLLIILLQNFTFNLFLFNNNIGRIKLISLNH